MASTMPRLHVEHSGPVARPALTANGRAAKAPKGKTVSWWPTISTFDDCPNRVCTCGPASLSTSSAWRPSRRSITSRTEPADRVMASMSCDGDSIVTRYSRSASIESSESTHPLLLIRPPKPSGVVSRPRGCAETLHSGLTGSNTTTRRRSRRDRMGRDPT